MIKYSIILPYYKRPELKSTLVSFVYHYSNRKDYQVMVVEDSKNYEDQESHNQLHNIINEFRGIINIDCIVDNVVSYCPSRKYNIGFLNTYGQFILLSNPETPHETNILAGLDSEFDSNPNNYIVCSCKNCFLDKPIVDNFQEILNNRIDIWYQHSNIRNKLYHFCSAISRENYIKIGGFDERYMLGMAYDDDSLVERIKRNGINIKTRDDLISIHINHSREYQDNKSELITRNRDLFYKQMDTNDFYEPNRINDRSRIC